MSKLQIVFLGLLVRREELLGGLVFFWKVRKPLELFNKKNLTLCCKTEGLSSFWAECVCLLGDVCVGDRSAWIKICVCRDEKVARFCTHLSIYEFRLACCSCAVKKGWWCLRPAEWRLGVSGPLLTCRRLFKSPARSGSAVNHTSR